MLLLFFDFSLILLLELLKNNLFLLCAFNKTSQSFVYTFIMYNETINNRNYTVYDNTIGIIYNCAVRAAIQYNAQSELYNVHNICHYCLVYVQFELLSIRKSSVVDRVSANSLQVFSCRRYGSSQRPALWLRRTWCSVYHRRQSSTFCEFWRCSVCDCGSENIGNRHLWFL